jgi:hypothetical protein
LARFLLLSAGTKHDLGIDMATATLVNAGNPTYMRHDLMIEIFRIEQALDEAKARQLSVNPDILSTLERRRAALNDALVRLSA